MATGKFVGLASLNTEHRPRHGAQSRNGKKSDPNFHQYCILLTKASWRQAQALMHTPGLDSEFQASTGRLDFSELMQSLLDNWLAEQKKR